MQSRFLTYLIASTSVFALCGTGTEFSVVQQKKSPYDAMSLDDLKDLRKQHCRAKKRALVSCVKCTAVAACSCVTVPTVIGVRLCCDSIGLSDAIAAVSECLFVSGIYMYFDNKSKIMEQKDREIKSAIEDKIASLHSKEHQD